MRTTAEAHLKTLPASQQAAVAAVRARIQRTPFQPLQPKTAKDVRDRFRRSLAADTAQGLTIDPMERQLALQMIRYGVPTEKWTPIAKEVIQKGNGSTPELLQDHNCSPFHASAPRVIACVQNG